jgi:hypothetical protein
MRWLLLLIASFVAGTAAAQTYLSPDPPPYSIDDRFRVEVDLFRGSYNTDIRLDNVVTNANGTTTTIPGTEVSGEHDLGLASAQYLGQLELTLLPGRHHMIRLSGLSMRRDGHNILTRNVSWGNSNYRVGERVDSHLNLTMAGLTYGYLPLRTDRYELGVTLGVQIGDVNANAEVRSRSIRGEEAADGPIPYVGVEGRYEFTRHWSVDGRMQYFTLSPIESFVDVNGVKATITDWRFAIRFRQNQHFVYGLGYHSFNLNINSPATNPAGLVVLGLKGPMLFAQASL